jgi:L-alanine-DL-glutamate epimerase-like enolase superfamily enzyme
MKLRIIRVDLPLKHVFTTSQRSVSVVRTIVVELEQDGLRGHGEAYEDPVYGTDVETMVSLVEECRGQVEHYALADPVALWRHLDPILGKNKFAQSAVDCAACDLWGKMKNKPLWKIWGFSLDRLPNSSLCIGLDSKDRILERIAESPDWPAYRIKLGERNDMEILQMLRKQTNAAFRVDVNGAWSVETAIKNLAVMKDLNVELLEQPLAADDWDGMKRLRKEIKKKNYEIPIFADESWKKEDDIDRCVGIFDGINLKLTKCGGLTPARQVAAKAKHLGLRLMSATSIESTIGASAISQLAPLFDFIGIDGPLIIEKKVGIGVHAEKGKLIYPTNENGTGVRTTFR